MISFFGAGLLHQVLLYTSLLSLHYFPPTSSPASFPHVSPSQRSSSRSVPGAAAASFCATRGSVAEAASGSPRSSCQDTQERKTRHLAGTSSVCAVSHPHFPWPLQCPSFHRIHGHYLPVQTLSPPLLGVQCLIVVTRPSEV